MAFLSVNSRPAATVASAPVSEECIEIRNGRQRDRDGDTSALRRLVRLEVEWSKREGDNNESMVQDTSAVA